MAQISREMSPSRPTEDGDDRPLAVVVVACHLTRGLWALSKASDFPHPPPLARETYLICFLAGLTPWALLGRVGPKTSVIHSLIVTCCYYF